MIRKIKYTITHVTHSLGLFTFNCNHALTFGLKILINKFVKRFWINENVKIKWNLDTNSIYISQGIRKSLKLTISELCTAYARPYNFNGNKQKKP